MPYLVILFIVIPFTELYFLVQIAEAIGFWQTLILQVITAMVGVSLAKMEGFKVWWTIQRHLQEGQMPNDQLLDGLMILTGGLVLLTPGLITDALGLLLIIPITRSLFKSILKNRFKNKIHNQSTSVEYILIDTNQTHSD